jgi:hypothetical protein
VESRFRGGLLALPLPGAGVTFFAAAKKVTKESSSFKPAVTRTLATLASPQWPSPKCRPHRPNRAWLAHGLTPRAACVTGSAPYSSSPLRGRPVNRVCAYLRANAAISTHCTCVPLVSLAYPTAARSAVPKLFRAEPARLRLWLVRPCASQARLVLRGRHLGECHWPLASMANVRVTAGLNELLSLVTFFAAAKKVTAAPHRGSANRPKRTRDPTTE